LRRLMSLTSGTRLGPYEIQSPLGAGGMGEVYRARDTRLERSVAIKVLNAQLVASSELRARFEREAKIISQLQHPNICVLHDAGRTATQGASISGTSVDHRHRNCRCSRKSTPRRSGASRPEAGQCDAYEIRRQAAGFAQDDMRMGGGRWAAVE
jgi:serine/threonine protein kinase